MPSDLQIVPITLRAANAYVAENHAHHGPVVGHLFAVACQRGGALCGVAIVGRPSARMLQDGRTCEVTRVCTDRTPHAASKLIAAATRAAFALGYTRVCSYTLAEELGTSYRAAGWVPVAESGGGTWARTSRPRTDKHPTGPKRRWERRAA